MTPSPASSSASSEPPVADFQAIGGAVQHARVVRDPRRRRERVAFERGDLVGAGEAALRTRQPGRALHAPGEQRAEPHAAGDQQLAPAEQVARVRPPRPLQRVGQDDGGQHRARARCAGSAGCSRTRSGGSRSTTSGRSAESRPRAPPRPARSAASAATPAAASTPALRPARTPRHRARRTPSRRRTASAHRSPPAPRQARQDSNPRPEGSRAKVKPTLRGLTPKRDRCRGKGTVPRF